MSHIDRLSELLNLKWSDCSLVPHTHPESIDYYYIGYPISYDRTCIIGKQNLGKQNLRNVYFNFHTNLNKQSDYSS